MERLIGLWSNLGCGKSTVAKRLVERHGYKEFLFAGPLKDLCGDLFDWDHATLFGASDLRNTPDPRGGSASYWTDVFCRLIDLEDRVTDLFAGCPDSPRRYEIVGGLSAVLHDLEALGARLTPRVALQLVGTEWGREIWPSVWTHAALHAITSSGAPRVVISDVRFENEASLVAMNGGETWWLDAAKRVPRSVFAHASEATFKEARPFVQRVVDNNGTLAQLDAAVDALASSALGCAA